MDSALLLLLKLRFFAWFRRVGRKLKTTRGVLLTALGLMVFAPQLIAGFMGAHAQTPEFYEGVRRFMPVFLLIYCLITLIFSPGEKAFAFTPAEVGFLFPAPFSRRQLLGYKIAGSVGLTFLTGIFVTFGMKNLSPNIVSAYFGGVLSLAFIQLFAMLVTLAGQAIGEAASGWRRRLALAVVVGVVGGTVLSLGYRAFMELDLETLKKLESAPAVRIALAPFQPFANLMTARRFWPGMLGWGAVALAIDALLVVGILALDASYLESAAVNSERMYAKLERMRKGGPTITSANRKKPFKGLPSLPWWGGVGPILWRQLLTARRDYARTLVPFVVSLCLAGLGIFLILKTERGPEAGVIATGFASMILLNMALFTPLVNFDFRGDVDRMETLKSLPISANRIVLGQMAAPAFLLVSALVLALVLLGLGAGFGRLSPGYWAFPAFSIPGVLVLLEVDNIMFLWFPTRPMAQTPGDIQAMGRAILMMLAKLLTVAVAGGAAACFGAIGWLILGWPGAFVASWIALSAIVILLIPLVATAFRQFDVAADTPT